MFRKKNRIEKRHEFFRYVRKELNMDERNSFERDLQKDPFSEEAMDGINLFSAEEITKDYTELQKNLNKRIRGNRWLVIYRIAASVIILAGITSILIMTTGKKSHDEIAINTISQVPLEIPMSKPLTKPEKEIKPSPFNIESNKYSEKEPGNKKTNPEIFSPVKTEPSSEALKSKAIVQAPAGAIASSRSFAVKDTNEDSGLAMNEVTIMENDKSDSLNRDISGNFIPAGPLPGKKEFGKYIRDNIHNPDSSSGRKIIEMSFVVHADGSIDSFKIIRSPGKLFTEEAERLLKTGPAWKPAEQNGIAVEDRVNLRIIFR